MPTDLERPRQLRLGELIEILRGCDPSRVLPIGLGEAHSYRGYYDELAFVPTPNTSIGQMLERAEGAVGEVFDGWKGGEYRMDLNTPCWLAEGGETGETLGTVLLGLMLKGGAE
jgi:hypothetical protein